MIEALDFLYYFLLISEYLIGLVFLRKMVPILSFSGIYLTLNFIFIIIPGYYLYRGGAIYDDKFSIDTRTYILLLCQGLLAPPAIYAAWRNLPSQKISIEVRKKTKSIYLYLLLIVILYNIFYIASNVDTIPILKVFSGNFVEAAFDRVLLTHGFSESALPFYFAYYRLFTKDLIFVLLIPLCIFGKFLKSVPDIFFLLSLVFLLMMHIEKAYILYLFLGLYFAQSKFKPPTKWNIVLSLMFVLLASVLVTYALFANNIMDAVSYLPTRLVGQTGYTFAQLRQFDDYGFLGINGINLGFIGRLLSINFVDVSKLAFNDVNASAADLIISGSSAGAAFPEAYMTMGYFAPLFFIFFVTSTAVFDKYLYSITIVNFKSDSIIVERLAKSFYIYFACFYPLALVGTMFAVFSVTTLFQPPLLVVMIFFILIFRLKIKRSLIFGPPPS